MRKIISYITVVSLLFLNVITITSCRNNESLQNSIYNETQNKKYNRTMKQDILCLMMGYPENIVGVEKSDRGYVYILMKSGSKILYDDKKDKDFSQKLANPDLQDMMEQIYPLNNINGLMEENYDPGRIRVYPLLEDIYGSSKREIELNLKKVKVGYKNLVFNKSNSAANNLKNVMNELVPLANNNWKIYGNSFPSSGTYNYRYISGTGRLSPHAFGIAIDLKRDNRDYWKWASRKQGEARIKEYPKEIVNIFEKNNFVWGGKWGHFDILHFEYRPEIILKAKYFSETNKNNEAWYENLKPIDKTVKGYIDKIENELN